KEHPMATAMKSVKTSVSPIPEGHTTVTPYLVLKNIDGFLDFAKTAFDAKLTYKMEKPDGSVGHCELQIGNARVMAGGACEDMSEHTAMLYLYVPDSDATYKKAVAAGATSQQEPKDMFWGDRAAAVKDQSGNVFWIGTRIEEVSQEELKRRF